MQAGGTAGRRRPVGTCKPLTLHVESHAQRSAASLERAAPLRTLTAQLLARANSQACSTSSYLSSKRCHMRPDVLHWQRVAIAGDRRTLVAQALPTAQRPVLLKRAFAQLPHACSGVPVYDAGLTCLGA